MGKKRARPDGGTMSLQEANRPPQKSDYRETIKLLADFFIQNIDVPQFPTVAALTNWRTGIIKQHLSTY